MRIEAFVGLADQIPIKALLASAGFIASDQQDGVLPRIEGERQPLFASLRTEAQLLHVGVARPFWCIHPRPAEVWSKLLQQARQGKDLCLHIFIENVELGSNSSAISTAVVCA
jgi:hypothetical protein